MSVTKPECVIRRTRGLIMAAALAVLAAGCTSSPQPSRRFGACFGYPGGVGFPDPDNLGRHHSRPGFTEKNGMVYTCRGGFIDLGHVREAADRTEYLAILARGHLTESATAFSYEVIEPSIYHISIRYPDDWSRLPADQRQQIIDDLSIHLGQYLAHTSTVWHEIVTWFGFASFGLFSEHISSFSGEDTYSDLLGTRLAVQALTDPHRDFDTAMAELIDRQLDTLGAQPVEVAKLAARRVKEKWYTGGLYFFADMKKRNFDTGRDDGRITPWLVPGICDARPLPCTAPDPGVLTAHGFRISIRIEPRESQAREILSILHPHGTDRGLDPLTDFPRLISYIEAQARAQYGPDVAVPTL